MASPPSSSGLEEPWQPCRGQPHGAPLTWTFQPAILAERGPSAPSGMRPPAAARLAGCGGAMGAALPGDGSSARQGAGGAATGPGEARLEVMNGPIEQRCRCAGLPYASGDLRGARASVRPASMSLDQARMSLWGCWGQGQGV